jgi:hypothetical protein
VFKNIPPRPETRVQQFRGERYDAFDHSRFSSVDTSARFDTAGQQVHQRLGRVLAARRRTNNRR